MSTFLQNLKRTLLLQLPTKQARILIILIFCYWMILRAVSVYIESLFIHIILRVTALILLCGINTSYVICNNPEDYNTVGKKVSFVILSILIICAVYGFIVLLAALFFK